MAQVAAVLGALAGVWIAISPWFLTLGRGTATDLIVGLVVAALGAFGIAGRRGFLGLQVGSLLLGIWSAVSIVTHRAVPGFLREMFSSGNRFITQDIRKAGAFGLYAVFGVAAVAFFAWKLPETKDRGLEDIERQVHG